MPDMPAYNKFSFDLLSWLIQTVLSQTILLAVMHNQLFYVFNIITDKLRLTLVIF